MKYLLLSLTFTALFLADIAVAEFGVYCAIHNDWNIAFYQAAIALFISFMLQRYTIFDIYKQWRQSKTS